MKIVSINLGNFGSTGMIMRGIVSCLDSNDNIFYCAYPWDPNNKPTQTNDITIGCKWSRRLSILLGSITGLNGCFSFLETRSLLKQLDKINPEIVHLHNLHNCYINLPMLFRYIKKRNICTVWTLHDCWAMTGQCPHFTMAKCERWKTGCYDCPSYREYPQSRVDRTKTMWKLKKKWFAGVEKLTIVTPSHWLADLVKQSYLKDYPVKVIYNGIDLDIFKPTESDFRERYNCQKKFILLGVAFGWGMRKGLDVFVELSKRLPETFQIVLVGTDYKVDNKIPNNIISIHRTQNQVELAQIYTAANLFVNPTREEVLGLVNIEANACGTPVLTFRTGGSPECIDETSGSVVECDNVDAMELEILRIYDERPYTKEACLKCATRFNKNDRFKEYISMYMEQIERS